MTERLAFARPHPLLRLLFVLVLMSPDRAYVEVDDASVRVRFGIGFVATIPRASVVAAAPDGDRVLAWGAHGFAGRWLVNPSSKGIVALTLIRWLAAGSWASRCGCASSG
ncbi:MAG TPA: hypothetical protein VHO29_20495 [Marmoricola sp.]|nr:hypothetical protein [Marmoricola sp.]